MDETAIKAMLDQLAEYQAQVDVLEMQKRELLNEVKVPAEVLAAQDEANRRRQKADSEYIKRQKETDRIKAEALAAVTDPELPAEYMAALEAARLERGKIEARFSEYADDDLEALRKIKAQIEADLQSQVRDVFTQVEQRKAEIDAEFSGKAQIASGNMDKLREAIKKHVAQFGESVKGSTFHAVYVKGRVTWNTDMLDGMIVAFPALAKARKEGQPGVTIRKV